MCSGPADCCHSWKRVLFALKYGWTQLERAAKQRCFLSGLQLIHCLHYFVGGVMGSSPGWDTLWPLAPGQKEPHTNKGVTQNTAEDIWGSPAIWGSSCTRKWKMPAYFLSKLWFCGTTAAKMSWWNVRAPRAARNQQFSVPRQTDTCSWLKSESSQPSSATPPRSQQKSCCADVFTIITNHTRKIIWSRHVLYLAKPWLVCNCSLVIFSFGYCLVK